MIIIINIVMVILMIIMMSILGALVIIIIIIMMVIMMIILGALVIMPSIRCPMAEPAGIRDRIDRPPPAWMSCKIIEMIMMIRYR